MSKNVAAEIALLEELDTPALRRRWAEIFENSSPPRASRDFLLRVPGRRIWNWLIRFFGKKNPAFDWTSTAKEA